MQRVLVFLIRTEQRCYRPAGDVEDEHCGPFMHSDEAKRTLQYNPNVCLTAMKARYPDVTRMILAAEDVGFFLQLCKTGGKPVPFIPVIDVDLEVWFKKDSLWYSEDLDAVPDRDAERVCVLHGPVAVKHCSIANEPVADILGGIVRGYVQKMTESGSAGTTADYLTNETSPPQPDDRITITTENKDNTHNRTFTINNNDIPPSDTWIRALAGAHANWLHALLSPATTVSDLRWTTSRVRQLLTPRPGSVAVVAYQRVLVGSENRIFNIHFNTVCIFGKFEYE